jgi:hypothetical protein
MIPSICLALNRFVPFLFRLLPDDSKDVGLRNREALGNSVILDTEWHAVWQNG